MNIDIRNIDFEAELNDVMSHSGEKTATKAMRHAVVNFLPMKNKIDEQRDKIRELESKVWKMKRNKEELKDALQTIFKFTGKEKDAGEDQ